MAAYDPNKRSFDWCYTFNDVSQCPDTLPRHLDNLHADLDAALDRGELSSYAATAERGGGTGHLHVHVFLQFRKRQRSSRWRSLLGASSPFVDCRPNVLPRLGSPEECLAYHTKEETCIAQPVSGGELQPDRRGQGRRSDLDIVGQRVRDGASPRDIATDFTATFIRYHRGIGAAIDVLHRPLALDTDPGALLPSSRLR